LTEIFLNDDGIYICYRLVHPLNVGIVVMDVKNLSSSNCVILVLPLNKSYIWEFVVAYAWATVTPIPSPIEFFNTFSTALSANFIYILSDVMYKSGYFALI
jgi:hypothetical protein